VVKSRNCQLGEMSPNDHWSYVYSLLVVSGRSDLDMDCIGLGGMTVTPFFKISNHCSTVDAVSFKL